MGSYRGGAPRPGNHGQTTSGNASRSGTTGGAGSQAIASGSFSKPYNNGLQEARKEQRDLNKARATQSGTAGKQTQGGQGGQPPGGTATSWDDEPGSVQNRPYADLGTIVDQAVTALPGGVLNAIPGVPGALNDPSKPMVGAVGQMLDADPGPQVGYQRDRGRGASSFNPNDARGLSADEEREIAGRPFHADGTDETDDPGSETPAPAEPGDIYSDVMLKDRRKPVPTLKQMLESML